MVVTSRDKHAAENEELAIKQMALRAEWLKTVYVDVGSTAYLSTGFLQKESCIVYPGVLHIFNTKNRWDIEKFAFGAWWYNFW
jgi:hypothetical protein